MVDTPARQAAYAQPLAFERHQDDTGHLSAERLVLSSMLDYVGQKVVSLGCGTGWLDRELIKMREDDLVKGRTKLRLLGLDSSQRMIDQANAGMKLLLGRNPRLQECLNNSQLCYDYKVATLGERSFAELDLSTTVIKSPAPDTFLAFMVFVLWVRKREPAIEAIASKSRGETTSFGPTTVISAEEYPIHITRDSWITLPFIHTVQKLMSRQMDPKKIWRIFDRNGFKIQSGPRETSLGGPKDHIMRSAAFEYDR
jgi:SAM-dependent methyltransferase